MRSAPAAVITPATLLLALAEIARPSLCARLAAAPFVEFTPRCRKGVHAR